MFKGKIIFIILFIVLIFATNCRDNINFQNQITQININPTLIKDIVLSDIFSHIDYVALETNENSLIGEINSIKFEKDYFFINDGHGISIFDKDGSFIKKIGKEGKGPGEFVSFKNFYVNSDEKNIDILDINGKKIIKYNFNGDLIDEKQIDLYAYEFSSIDNENEVVFYSGYEQNSKSSYSINYVNLNTNKITKSFLPVNENMAYYYFFMQQRNFYSFNDSLFCLHDPFDTIYHITKDKILPSRVLNFGKYSVPKKLILEKYEDTFEFGDKMDQLGYIHHVNHFIENQNYIYLTFRFKKETYQCFYDKRTGESSIGSYYIDDLNYNGLRNKFNYSNTPHSFDNNVFYYIIEPHLLKENIEIVKKSLSKSDWLKFKKNNRNIFDLEENLNLESNPIVAIYHLK